MERMEDLWSRRTRMDTEGWGLLSVSDGMTRCALAFAGLFLLIFLVLSIDGWFL